MNAQELVKQAMKATNTTSARQLSELIGASHVAIWKWQSGTNLPSFEQAAELAELAGLPPVRTAAEVRENADGGKHKRLLRRLATAAVITLTIGTCGAIGAVHNSSHNPGTMYIMSNTKRRELIKKMKNWLQSKVQELGKSHGTPTQALRLALQR